LVDHNSEFWLYSFTTKNDHSGGSLEDRGEDTCLPWLVVYRPWLRQTAQNLAIPLDQGPSGGDAGRAILRHKEGPDWGTLE